MGKGATPSTRCPAPAASTGAGAHARAHSKCHRRTRTACLAAFATVAVPGVDLLLPRLGYVVINLAGAAVVAWKLRAMGLLPLTSADWISLIPDTVFTDHSAGALPLS